jgi:hypothetical protein
MNLRKIILGVALAVAPMQASIIATATDPGLSLLQDFISSSPAQSKNAPTGTPITAFSGITLTSSGGALVYDPNPTGQDCTSQFNKYANCVGNYTVDQSSNYTGITSTDLTYKLAKSTNATAFYLFVDPTLNIQTKVSVLNVDGGVQDSFTFDPNGPVGFGTYILINEAFNFANVQISGVGAGSNFTSVAGYGFTVAHIEVAPEPGTIGMFGLGLGALGFFARRRKS